ncbi:helix-turn-helix domain-containing protein [uncultured Bradyrhizobium sp.]|uniref:helix-turn-helix domain-containing protein n=1 Tax=uncultured Bradyrhizobium sp. TaxID=199684 RepID=UPI0035C9FACE
MLQHSPLDLPLGNSSAPTPSTPERTCHWVAFCVARDFGFDMVALFAPTRGTPRVAFARQVAMYLAHTGFELSLETISRVFDRDRTTVFHACHVVEDGRDDVWLDCRLEALELSCRAGFDALREAMPEISR